MNDAQYVAPLHRDHSKDEPAWQAWKAAPGPTTLAPGIPSRTGTARRSPILASSQVTSTVPSAFWGAASAAGQLER